MSILFCICATDKEERRMVWSICSQMMKSGGCRVTSERIGDSGNITLTAFYTINGARP